MAADANNGMSPAQPESGSPVTVPVVAVSTLTTTALATQNECRPTLTTVRQYEVAQANARPWFVRNLEGLTGAPLGAAGAAWLAAHYLTQRIWILPAALAGGAVGWVVGPLGIVLGAGGGVLGHALTHKWPVTAAGGVAGVAIGMALWHVLIPPPKPATPDSPVDVPLEHFVTNDQCGDVQHTRFRGGDLYKIDFVLDGRAMSVDLPYDPGNSLSVYPDGQPVTQSLSIP
ncbi:hypothetical protein [Caballeronia sp. LZ034LL]|uniref:hypothetical protein n=1 Tax=Caballeronia sp. LZ034LL TaxID=3038567 RepID=UPI00285863AB|nr:hypothetical protein [Caballeronia sp. LZ034LL]MDR5837089.1 hypothetical protein [Caballeronia sp. LZ034LL]